MFEAANGHKRVLLRDIAEPVDGAFVDGPFGSNLKSDEYVEAGVRLIQLQNIGDGYWKDDNKKYITNLKFRSLARHGAIAGDIAIAKMADPVARACIVPRGQEQYVVVADCIRLRVDEALFDPRYIVRAINSHGTRTEAERKSIGSTRIRINLGTLKTVGCLVPPLVQQQAIAEILDTLDTTIRQTEAIIEKLKRVKQGLLHDLLTRGIDASGELRPPQGEAPHLYKDSPLGWIPREWTVDFLGKLAEVAGGVTLGRSVTGIGTLELPYLRVANVQDGYLDLGEIKTIRILSSELARYRLEPGDVLMNEGGDFDKLGRGVMWSGEIDTCLHQNHVFRVRCQRGFLDPRYLTAYSSSGFGKAFFVQASKQTTNLASINSTQLKAFPLRLPKLAEQHAIVDGLTAIDLRVRAEDVTLNKARLQKSGLMDDLLTGRVRVTPLLA